MCSERYSGMHTDYNPNATQEQIAEWENFVKECEERRKKQMSDERPCCGNCNHHTPPYKSGQLIGWTCNNEQSDNYGLTTEYGDRCSDYEERD